MMFVCLLVYYFWIMNGVEFHQILLWHQLGGGLWVGTISLVHIKRMGTKETDTEKERGGLLSTQQRELRERKRQRYLWDFALVSWEANSRRSRGRGIPERGRIMCFIWMVRYLGHSYGGAQLADKICIFKNKKEENPHSQLICIK